MRTLLSKFCEEFDQSVRPLLTPLKHTTSILTEHPDRDYSRALLPGLLDVTHQLEVLVEKVAEQQAYVLIFGPLKSGKSTLMNAMAAAYVSEVTSLPAYPAMVYVSHSEQREFEVTRYNGQHELFHDPAALRLQVARAHTELADHIRRVESEGGSFDPTVHYPEALRRIDVRIPAGELAQSGSVLVDTPGLYSRMKFGYDRMTREFRNAAACAIFVVKTDNLFLEQVFEEFNQLLELFSRIFLVINLDGTKRDLHADGTLQPSLESADPLRIVEAFENLSMIAPLKQAADEGRLQIYPVDLQRAASRRLSGEGDPVEVAALGIDTEGQADFEGFMSDLTDYLSSTDYLFAFLGDSLRHAKGLLGDVTKSATHGSVDTISERVSELEESKAACRAKLSALGRLTAFDWDSALAGLRDELAEVGRSASTSVAQDSAHATAKALDGWFQNDKSLQSLIDDELRPLLAGGQREIGLQVHSALSEHVGDGVAAVRLPGNITEDLVAAGIHFGEFGRTGLDCVDPLAGVQLGVPPLYAEEIPVKRGFWDILFFRSKARVRRRLFGAPEKPSLRIPRDLKAKRLGDPARELMRRKLSDFQKRHLPSMLDGLAQRIFEDYAQGVLSGLSDRLARTSAEAQAELEGISARLREYRRILNSLLDLSAANETTEVAVTELSERYSETDPDHLIDPVPDSEAEGLEVMELIPREAPPDEPLEVSLELDSELDAEPELEVETEEVALEDLEEPRT